MHRLCFSTADDPFYKSTVSKYFPECMVLDEDGKVLSVISADNRKDEQFQMTYLDDFRDPALKINDDKKIQIQLGAIQKPGTSILLIVKETEPTGKVSEDHFKRAWFRLSNEETNQTLDYSKVTALNPDEEEGEFQASFPDPDDEENELKNTMTYLHGRLYLNEDKHWCFESIQ